ncbi:alpha-sarcoglycan [Nasonia vitripennis]|uniref:Epsilon-sarcoglycan n=1 Tax=Nasonia vitripennis TaxID=7425 RepID=A0A7M7QIT3_NASVI|nr:alpha-sarcoglycan [Nasonia vitripennis]XP_016841318.1 alpha-sarcoglycan [Nasonia vitripennis]XP_031786999.1 alpha-sarcoglycan [Nasonia vitripennis]
MIPIAALSVLCLAAVGTANDIPINSLQLFAISVVPKYFNWTSDEGRNDYDYEASLVNSPDLPPWIHYTYSKRTHRGYLYGVAPKDQKNFTLEIVALNKKTYETRTKVLEVVVSENESISKYQVQLKVNWNVEDMFDHNRTETLDEIFRKQIWKNATDLQLTFLAPAVELGARYPLKPGEEVGSILRLGSSTPFSNDLQGLEKELEPVMKKYTTCPFKQASFDRFFPGFQFDWCYFRLIEESYGLQQESARRDMSASIISGAGPVPERSEWRWSQPRKAALPTRSYRKEIFTSVFVPALLLLLLVGFLSAALCLHHAEDLISSGKRGTPLLMDNGGTNGVQMIQYAATSSSRGTLRSLSQTQPSCSPTLSDSQSINRSPKVAKDHSSNSYVRPNPPPYISPNNFGGTGMRADF